MIAFMWTRRISFRYPDYRPRQRYRNDIAVKRRRLYGVFIGMEGQSFFDPPAGLPGSNSFAIHHGERIPETRGSICDMKEILIQDMEKYFRMSVNLSPSFV